LDFLRFAIFVPPDSMFVQLGSFLHLCQARFGLIEMTRRLNCHRRLQPQKRTPPEGGQRGSKLGRNLGVGEGACLPSLTFAVSLAPR
jgi:hypothetical protein